MSPSGSAALECGACGSTRLRAARPHGAAERLAWAAGTHFHVCNECGSRGTHRGSHRSRRVKRADGPGRPVEGRDLRAMRARAVRRSGTVLVAIALGGWLGFYVWSCEARNAERRPPDAVAQ
jgi:hypothetical protein